MSISLTITDNADGTGGTCAFVGSDPASTNAIYVYTLADQLGQCALITSFGSATPGDRSGAFSLAAGHYVFCLVSTLAGVSTLEAVAYAAITDAADAVQFQILEAVQARLRLLLLSGVEAGSIVVKKLPMQRTIKEWGLPMPAILVTPIRETMNPAAGTNLQDDVVFPAMLTIIEADNQEATLSLHLDRHTKWRERIERAFHNQRLPGVPAVFNCAVEPADAIIPQAWAQNLYASAIVLKFTARVPRGLTA
jgi:hypothetical protein